MLLLLERTAVNNHFAIEISVSIRCLLNQGKSISLGVMLPQWQSRKVVDLLSSQTEVVIIASINQRIFKNLVIGLEVYGGRRDLYPVLNIGGDDVIIKNQAAMITIGYQL
ncbi:MAG: hypothetical protein ACI9XJ_002694 [Marivirga sp.]|jgi:hypothetical protein